MPVDFTYFYLSLTIAFLVFFSIIDLKKREIENAPIILFFVLAAILKIAEIVTAEISLMNVLLFGSIWIIQLLFLATVYKICSIGGADIKIMAVLSLLYPFFFFPMFALSGILSLVYMAISKFPSLNKYLEIERGVPFICCLLMSVVLFYIVT